MQMSIRSATSGICWQETRRRPYSESLQCPERINSALGSETSRCCTESSQRRQQEWCREVVKFMNEKMLTKPYFTPSVGKLDNTRAASRFQYLEDVNTVFLVMASTCASFIWENLTWVEVSPSRVNSCEMLWKKKVYPFARVNSALSCVTDVI